MYPSATQLLVVVLQAQFSSVRVCTELPEGLELVLPVIQVSRFGGGAAVVGMDRPMIDVDVWHSTLEAAEVLGSQVSEWMHLGLPGRSASGPSGAGVFARSHMQSGMARRPTANTDVFRVGSAWTLHLHSY